MKSKKRYIGFLMTSGGVKVNLFPLKAKFGDDP